MVSVTAQENLKMIVIATVINLMNVESAVEKVNLLDGLIAIHLLLRKTLIEQLKKKKLNKESKLLVENLNILKLESLYFGKIVMI